MVGARRHQGHQPLREEPAGRQLKLFLDLHTMSVPSGEVSARWGHLHSAQARTERAAWTVLRAAALTVARTRGVAVPLSWSWSHQRL